MGPTPLFMEPEVAFCEVQESVTSSPESMEDGLAVSAHVGAAGGGACVTVTLAAQLAELTVLPKLPLYVALCVG